LKANYARATLQRGPTYVLTYASSANQRDGKFHSIRVAVSRTGLTVRSKRGYYAFREGGSITPAVALPRNLSRDARTALEDDIPRPGISISLSAAAFKGEESRRLLVDRPGMSVLVGIDVDLKTTQVNRRSPLELAWAAPKPSPPGGWPLPLISPALAVLAAPPSRIAVANTVAAAVRNRMFPPKMMLMVLTLYWKPVGQMRIPRPRCLFFLTWTSATHCG
jgi:hypothetical protein